MLYKLTDSGGRTRPGMPNELTWGAGITHSAEAHGTKLCTPQVIHAYPTALLAVLMNPAHSNYKNPVLWEAEGKVEASDGTKVGCKSLTTIRQIELPVITTNQRVRFAILCAAAVPQSREWTTWARNWLNGADRSVAAARAAVLAAAYDSAAPAPARAAATAAAYAANAATAAVYAADAASTLAASYAAIYTANAAIDAARAAATAATVAARAAADSAATVAYNYYTVDFSALAEHAISGEAESLPAPQNG